MEEDMGEVDAERGALLGSAHRKTWKCTHEHTLSFRKIILHSHKRSKFSLMQIQITQVYLQMSNSIENHNSLASCAKITNRSLFKSYK
jgi:hypothetical protein